MAQASRPLSPHLGIYRWYFTMALSIAHRVTGGALAVALVLLAWWLLALAGGPDSFATVRAVMDNLFGGLILFVLTACLYLPHAQWRPAPGLGYGPRHLARGRQAERDARRRWRGRADRGDLARDPAGRLRNLAWRPSGKIPERPHPGAGLGPRTGPSTGCSSAPPRWRCCRSPCGSSSPRSRSPAPATRRCAPWLAAPLNTTAMLLTDPRGVLACAAGCAGHHRGLCP